MGKKITPYADLDGYLKKSSVVEVLSVISAVMARGKIHSNQIAVITSIALHPGCTLKTIVERTKLSEQHICRIIRYLIDTGDVRAISGDKVSAPRRFWITSVAIRTLNGIISEMRGLDR